MKQTAVEWLVENYLDLSDEYNNLSLEEIVEYAKELEKQQLIDCGNSCALKQHLHSDRINKMSMEELEQYDLEPSYTFGEEYYNKIFKSE